MLAHHVHNLAPFTEQAEAFAQVLLAARLKESQQQDMDSMLAVGDLFTLIVYRQLILEQAKLVDLETDVLDANFDFLVCDFSSGGGMRGTSAPTGWLCIEPPGR